MSILSRLSPSPGSKKARRRIGRGIGSGFGKTAGKGHKGMKARSGGTVRPRFEGGQTPLQRRLPKRGFNNAVFEKAFGLVQLHDLARFSAGDEVTPETLKAKGLSDGRGMAGVKILGNGELTVALKVRVHKVTKGAKALIEAAGGTVELIPEAVTGPGRPKGVKRSAAAAKGA